MRGRFFLYITYDAEPKTSYQWSAKQHDTFEQATEAARDQISNRAASKVQIFQLCATVEKGIVVS